MSIVNIYEVCYDAAKISGFEEGAKLYDEIRRMPIKIIKAIGKNLMNQAIYFKVKYKMSVADSFALGLAKINRATVVSGDHHEFDIIEQANELVFYWIR